MSCLLLRGFIRLILLGVMQGALVGCAVRVVVPEGVTRWEGRVRWVESSQVWADCARLWETVRQVRGLAGCYRKVEGVCVIVTERVKRESDFRLVGHELVHCAWGPFHDQEWRWSRADS